MWGQARGRLERCTRPPPLSHSLPAPSFIAPSIRKKQSPGQREGVTHSPAGVTLYHSRPYVTHGQLMYWGTVSLLRACPRAPQCHTRLSYCCGVWGQQAHSTWAPSGEGDASHDVPASLF